MIAQRSTVASITMGLLLAGTAQLQAQGVTTAEISGLVTGADGEALAGANIVLLHDPSGTQYGAIGRAGGEYDMLNLRVGGPYTITVSFIGYDDAILSDIYLSLGTSTTLDFQLTQAAIEMPGVEVLAEVSEVFNRDRTGAATHISNELVNRMPSIKRSTRDLTRLDPRSDSNFSFGGRNWLYNNISLDGSYFNNSFGLDDPAPGGQANAEPVPFDAIEQVQVSVVPFDVREGGFTGAGINSVTKSGTNTLKATAYSYFRNESLTGNKVSGSEVIANPTLSFNQTGFSVSGAIIKNKLFFFLNGEIERRTDPGSNFVADEDGNLVFGESRVSAAVMDAISSRMKSEYDYDTGPYQDYTHDTNNNKFLLKLDWNISNNHKASFRFNLLDAKREQGPHPFVLSFNNTGRGPNSFSLPFRNSGYAINNNLQSYALEVNSLFGDNINNRFFFSYNRFRDFREPFSEDFPTIDIGEGPATYTTVGHEPFSIHNILDQDVLQITNNVSFFSGKHVITAGVNYEQFKFFNSFNIFRHGVFFLPSFLFEPAPGFFLGGATFSSVDDFLAATDPANPDQINFRGAIGSGDFKGELIDVAQFSIYGQDKLRLTPALTITAGVRMDMPIYNTKPVENPFSTGLDLGSNSIDQAKLPDATPLFSPRFGFNWDAKGDRSLQVRGGVGIFTGRIPFVWIGNVISNPGANPNLSPAIASVPDAHVTDDGEGRTYTGRSILQQSFDLNGIVPDFKWPQVLTTNVAVDAKLPGDMLGTLEFIYGKDINAIVMRNYDLPDPVRTLGDGRPYYTDADGVFERNADGGAGVYVLDNTSEGFNMTLTAQLSKTFDNGLSASLAYTYLQAKNNLKSTEIASVLWQNQPVQGDPNDPQISFSEFGNPHRIIGSANYRHEWSESMATSVGMFFEVAQGNQFIVSGGNRYSFVYIGDVNGDGYAGNDLIYIPKDQNDIVLADASDWANLDAFIKQDDYLSQNRGKIAERFGAINPWFTHIDLRILHDLKLAGMGGLQLSVDILNFGNLISSNWGVRKIASPAAQFPLALTGFNSNGEPILAYTGPTTDPIETFIDDPGLFSRWQIQIGLRYSF